MKHAPYIRMAENAETAVLMVHGIVGTPAHFTDLLPVIPESWSIYNILLDGHGGCVEDFSRTSMKKWETQVQTQLDKLLLTHRRVLIVAHSMGTLFAIQEASRCPDRVVGLFLLNVPLIPFVRPSAWVNSIHMALNKHRSTPSAQAMLADCGVELSPNLLKYLGWIPRFWELLVKIRKTKLLLPQLEVPTFTFQSRHDELVSFRSCNYLEGHPHITNTVLENSGHFGYSGADTALLRAKLTDMLLSRR